MTLLFTVIVTFFRRHGCRTRHGFAGMSAAAVISPMLITFLHMDPYMAVGIAPCRPTYWRALCPPTPTAKTKIWM